MAHRIPTALLVLLAIALPAAAQNRLSHSIEPLFEAIELNLDPVQDSYSGTARIELRVKETRPEVALHARGMNIQWVELRAKDTALAVRHEARANDVLVIVPATPLSAGDYTLTLEFARKFDTQATGLYRTEHEGRAYAFTDFEPADARQAFPCFDEPDFKIPFQITLHVPRDLETVSNTPVESETADGALKTVVFRRTPPLSSYLLAVAVGPLEAVSVPGTSIPTRIIMVQGRSALAKDAVASVPTALAALERYFGRPYPYEKLDLLAVPEFNTGAMENAGAITFLDSTLLIDPATSGPRERRSLLFVVTHELAHMWFGDLVTMEWWDDLWLNEAFAQWMAFKLVPEMHPEYQQDVVVLGWVARTMRTDARPSSPPIRRKIVDPSTVFQESGLTYLKGMAVLSMFEQWMGAETFRKGVLDYLAAHEWKNASAADLWAALSLASGRDVAAAMGTFLDQGGLPLVSVEPLEDGTLRVRQDRYRKLGGQAPDQLWTIPIVIRLPDGTTIPVLLDKQEATIRLPGGATPAWVLPNAGASGYYRWSVPAPMLETLVQEAPQTLSLRERVVTVGNLSALLDAGQLHGDDELRLLAGLARDPAPNVVEAVVGAFYGIHEPFIPDEMDELYGQYLRKSLGPVLDRIGLSPAEGEDPTITILRADIWELLAHSGGDTSLLEKARQLARSLGESTTSVDPSLVDTVVYLSAIHGDIDLFEEYRSRFEKARVPAERSRYLSALGAFRDPAILEEALSYSLKGPLKANEILFVWSTPSMSEPRRDRVFDWIMRNYAELAKRVPPGELAYLPFYADGCSAERLDKAVEFFSQPEHQVAGTQQQLVKLKERVSDCISLRDREGKAVTEFLRRQAAGDGAAGQTGATRPGL